MMNAAATLIGSQEVLIALLEKRTVELEAALTAEREARAQGIESYCRDLANQREARERVERLLRDVIDGLPYSGGPLHGNYVEALRNARAFLDGAAILALPGAAAQELEGLRRAQAALIELVACKDLKERLQSLHERGHGTDYDDYRRRQPLAWAEARTAIQAGREGA